MIKFFSSSEVDNFAKDLAKDIGERYPAAIANDPARKVSANRLTAILEDAFSQAAEFTAQNKLGYFKKAKLGNTFRWQLKEMGYDEKFVEVATEGLVVYITRKPAASKAAS
jgi:hypothetical protein